MALNRMLSRPLQYCFDIQSICKYMDDGSCQLPRCEVKTLNDPAVAELLEPAAKEDA